MGNTKTYENCMCDSDIMEVYKKDRCIGNELMLEKYHDYIYYIIKKHYPSFNREASELFQHGAIGIMNALQTYDPKDACGNASRQIEYRGVTPTKGALRDTKQ